MVVHIKISCVNIDYNEKIKYRLKHNCSTKKHGLYTLVIYLKFSV